MIFIFVHTRYIAHARYISKNLDYYIFKMLTFDKIYVHLYNKFVYFYKHI